MAGLLFELVFGVDEFEVFLNGGFVGGKEKINGVYSSGIELVLVACKRVLPDLGAC
ncbi:hypothetical protein [Verrucomicrobium spinosum]|uniref:hypothetical protein n=1 Tax=Verrucomicrobium spinosum TaxID=2736 RepID=UPI0001745E7B|nr:hypothetical protein [Verrucomicrobium spinosum]